MRVTWIVAVLARSFVLMQGCSAPVTRVQLMTPRIILHFYDDPAQAKQAMRTEGLVMATDLKPGEGGGGDFIFKGTGIIYTVLPT
jgi:hypothetical protein